MSEFQAEAGEVAGDAFSAAYDGHLGYWPTASDVQRTAWAAAERAARTSGPLWEACKTWARELDGCDTLFLPAELQNLLSVFRQLEQQP